MLRELAEMRALVAGQAQERSCEGLDAFRAALLWLFDCFTLVTHGLPFDFTHVEALKPGEVVRHVEHDALVLSGEGLPQCLLPHVREDAVEHWTSERGIDFPALRKAALEMSD